MPGACLSYELTCESEMTVTSLITTLLTRAFSDLFGKFLLPMKFGKKLCDFGKKLCDFGKKVQFLAKLGKVTF